MAQLKGLYAITDETLTPSQTVLAQTQAALQGGAQIVQLRDKTAATQTLIPLAAKLKALCEAHEALFVINDRIDLARAVQAHGVHLGEEDGGIEQAREILGSGAIVGISCYGDLERAKKMQEAGADYVAFGSFFISPTKPRSACVPIETLTRAKTALRIPLCAIGGITLDNAPSLIKAGADMIATISDLWQAEEITTQSKHYATLFEGTR